MAGVDQTEFLLPTAACAAFIDDLLRAGFQFTEPFELQPAECLARLTTLEMGTDEFWLCFWASPGDSASRRVDLHWHRLPGPDSLRLAQAVAARVQAIALQHGASSPSLPK